MPKTNGSPLDAPASLSTGTVESGVPRILRDAGFRGVLGHAVAVSALLDLVEIVRKAVKLDLQDMRREPPRQVGPDLERTQNDLMWSAPAVRRDGKARGRLYFLVEEQSTCDHATDLSMMLGVALHSMQLLSEYGIPVPNIVPVVLYTGERPWDAYMDVGDRFPHVPEESRTRMRYVLVDLYRLEVAEGSENLWELLAVVVRGASDAELLRGARALQRRLVALDDTHLEGSFFELVRLLCVEKWPEENWEDCANMTELVDTLEERTLTWSEKWKARYKAEGRAEDRADTSRAMLASLEKAVRTRFGASAAESFGRWLEVAWKNGAARDLEVLDAIVQCVTLSESAEQFLAGLPSIRTETDSEDSAGQD